MDDIAVLIPAYNEQTTITRIVDRCLHYIPHVFVVNDGSTDNTLSFIKKTAAVVFSNEVNQGKGAALLTGFQAVISESLASAGENYVGVITLDADGQHNPDDLARFFELIQKNPDTFIIGARRKQTYNAPKKRLFANKIADFFISCVARKKLCDTQSGYRYYPASFLKKYFLQSSRSTRFAFETEILIAAAKMGLSIAYVDIESCYPDQARASHYRPGRDSWEITKSVFRALLHKSIIEK
jgi:glycosyltransferase involved in cell wall biosynthesis